MQHIAEQGILNFGSTHARAYIASMLDMFETLAAHPELAAEREASQSKVRIMPCGAHHVVYSFKIKMSWCSVYCMACKIGSICSSFPFARLPKRPILPLLPGA
jgi:hypothetical protein